jgi:hypothetical protein
VHDKTVITFEKEDYFNIILPFTHGYAMLSLPTKMLDVFLFSPMRATSATPLIVLGLLILIISGDEFKL